MGEFFEIIGNLVDLVLYYISNIGEFLGVAFKSYIYLGSIITYLPFYMQSFLFLFLAVSILYLILNRS